MAAAFSGATLMAEAGDQMIVHDSGRLHEGINDRRADELETTRGELL
jgi:hypothetical protein